MRSLTKLYDKSLEWAEHRFAARYLALVSFLDSSVFPTPPYFMLAPMSLAQPQRALYYATIATVSSVLGGIVGYFLGMILFAPVVLPVLNFFHYVDQYNLAAAQLQQQGFWAVLIAGFMPIPFKLIAIGSGVMHLPIATFLCASLFGRAIKFYAVALIIKFGGKSMDKSIRLIIEKIGYILLAVVAGAVIFSLSGCANQAPVRVVKIEPSVKRLALHGKQRVKQSLLQKKLASNTDTKSQGWIWPTHGKVLNSFASNKKGIDIGGREGAPVVAAQDGEVVYSGNALRGYGNLIIVKHPKNFLTAYAHNRKNVVKEGDKVRKGQRIAELGRSGTDKVQLHFEIRQQGKPLDPQKLLPNR